MKKLIEVPFEEAVDGETYLTSMKHGWIEGQWNAKDKDCSGYYWRDIEWYPFALYRIVDEPDQIAS